MQCLSDALRSPDMPRSLALGNGSTLILYDRHGQVRDFYYPYAGLENHVGEGNVHKIGIWTPEGFGWISDPDWTVDIDYAAKALASRIVARSERLQAELVFTDVVYNERDVFVRSILVRNLKDEKRDMRLFMNQQFRISETTHADTAYWNPTAQAVIHYKGRRVFLVGGQAAGSRIGQYSIGLAKIEGKEGTWRDAEDGVLSGNAIEHGSVDSTVCFPFTLDASGEGVAEYWIAAAETLREAVLLQDLLLKKTPAHVIETTTDFWRAWVTKYPFTFHGLSPDVANLFEKSLLIIRTHCDNRGGILASGDSDNFRYGRDTYAYVWPRDGAFVALALDKAGYFDIPKRFYEFAAQVITEDGYMLHKYQPDKSFGSSWHPWVKNGRSQLAIQEDETALLLVSLWRHYEKTKDLEFVESVYNAFIKAGADFMVRYREGFSTRLPYASYDLWEEKNGISCFTACSVYGGLSAAARFAGLLGKDQEAIRYAAEAESIRIAIVERFWNEETSYFDKMLAIEGESLASNTTIDASALYGVVSMAVLPPDDRRVTAARETLSRTLERPIPVGGVARYVGDAYYEVGADVPGNPWFITTLWLAEIDILRARTEKDLESVKERLEWCVAHAERSGILSEQLNPETGEPLSVSPLTWSHAQFVLTVIAYLEKLEGLGVCTVCYPVK